MKACFLAAAMSIFLCAHAHAELKWEQTVIALHAAPGDKQAVGHFQYQNVGQTPVHIRSADTSCGCTVARSQKNDVAPGEKGEITATFNIGERTGLQQKSITVKTDDPRNPVAVLTLKTFIGQALTLKPALVYWQMGEEPKPKTIVARIDKNVPVKSLDVVSSSPEFLHKVERGPAPGEYRINVQPWQTTKPLTATLTIKTGYPAGSPKTYTVTMRVMPGAAAR
jgi:Protein of unknown function (DUF1573)